MPLRWYYLYIPVITSIPFRAQFVKSRFLVLRICLDCHEITVRIAEPGFSLSASVV